MVGVARDKYPYSTGALVANMASGALIGATTEGLVPQQVADSPQGQTCGAQMAPSPTSEPISIYAAASAASIKSYAADADL